MKPRRLVSDDLLRSIDVLNTLNGGISESSITLKQFPDHREIRARVPGVKEENFNSEIHNNVLMVYYTTKILSGEILIEIPKVLYNKQIPYFVDADKISASFEANRYVVKLPFNSLAHGYHRKVSAES